MKNEYIRRADAVDALAKTMPTPATPDGTGEFDHEIHIADEAFADAIRIIESIEPADVVPVVHGKWIPQDHNKRIGCATTAVFYYPKCSACGHNGNYDMYYCPNCGAKMDAQHECNEES